FRGDEHPEPDGVIGIGKASFQGCRQVRQGGRALRAVYGQPEQLPLADEGKDQAHRTEVDPSGHHFGHRLGSTFRRHMYGGYSCRGPEPLRTHMSIFVPAPPPEAKLNEPGLAAATNSCTVLTFREGEITSTFGELPSGMTGAKSRAAS